MAAATVNIHDIAVFPTSPYMGDTVTTTGIVIAVLADGFYIENQSGWDSNTCTSEGIYVYTPSIAPAGSVAMQDSVTVTGLVEVSNSSNYAGVQIYIASPAVGTNLVVNSTANTLPQTVSSDTLTQATSGVCSSYGVDAFGQWLPFEGMRVNVPSSSVLLVAQGTGGTVDPGTQTATTNGQFWAVLTTTRPTRAAGISILDPVYSTAIAAKPTIQEWSGNPQLLFVDSTAIGGSAYALDASATTEYTGSANLIGIVDYHLSAQGYTGLLLTAASAAALASQNGAQPTAVTTRGNNEITVATQDLNSLVAGETNRIAKLSYAIADYLKSPDVVAVQGATPAALGLLVNAIASAGGPSYTLTNASTADSNGLVNAFLVNAAKFDGTPTATQQLAAAAYTNTSGASATLFDRSPLLLTVRIPRTGIDDYILSVVNTTLLSRSGLSSIATSQATQLQREQQAIALAAWLAPLESAGEHLMVVGGFDSFEFSDGYVDALGILDGREAVNTGNGASVWLYDGASPSSLLDTTTSTPNLSATASAGAATVTPVASRYTYIENGSAEQPDHILISSEMSSLFSIDYARFGADFPDSLTYTTSTATTAVMVERASTHDGIVAYFTVPYPTSTSVTAAPNPSQYNDPVAFTAQVSVTGSTVDVPDGVVTFQDTGGVTLGTCTLSSGSCIFTTTVLSVGQHTVTAAYGGSESGLGYQSSSNTTPQEVDRDTATLNLVSSANPSILGQPVALTITADSAGAVNAGVTPAGIVTVSNTSATTALGTCTLSGGSCTLTTTSLGLGTHILSATFPGDATNSSATSNAVSQSVTPNTTSASVVSSEDPSYVGDSLTFTATLVGSYGTPTGSISFYDASTSTALGSATLAAATGTYTASATSAAIATLAVGSHVIQAIYAGDGTNAAVTASIAQVVKANASTLVLSSSLNPSYYGNSVTFSVAATALSGTPAGTVTFFYSTTPLGAGQISSGTATFTTAALPVGADDIQATYGGDGSHAAATSNTLLQIVQPVYATVSTLACTPNPAPYGTTVTCTDTVGVVGGLGTPSGTVTFFDGTSSLGSQTLTSGAATLAASALAVGSHSITAVYAENDPFLASTSNAVTEIIASTFTLTANPTSASVYTGEAFTSTIAVVPGTGFTLDVALTCSGLPAYTTCTLTPATVTGGSGSSKLVIQTTAPSPAATTASLVRSGAWPLLAGLLLFLAPSRWRRQSKTWLGMLLLVAAIATASIAGCGGSSNLTGGTPAGTYTVTIAGAANDGTLVIPANVSVSMNVKSLF